MLLPLNVFSHTICYLFWTGTRGLDDREMINVIVVLLILLVCVLLLIYPLWVSVVCAMICDVYRWQIAIIIHLNVATIEDWFQSYALYISQQTLFTSF